MLSVVLWSTRLFVRRVVYELSRPTLMTVTVPAPSSLYSSRLLREESLSSASSSPDHSVSAELVPALDIAMVPSV